MAESQQHNVMDPDQGDYGRLLALTDGLIATVLTVLVLDLRFPELTGPVTDAAIHLQFAAITPKLWIYLMTFLVGTTFWMSHNRDFGFIRKYDRALLLMNSIFLLGVSLLPFTSYLVGSYNTTFSWSVYALDMAMAGLSLTGIWGYASAAGLLAPTVPPLYTSYLLWRHLTLPGLFLASIIIAQFSPTLASWSAILFPLLYLLLARIHPGGRLRVSRSVPVAATIWRVVAIAPLPLIIVVLILLQSSR